MINARRNWILIPICLFFAGSVARGQGEKDSHKDFQIQAEKKVQIQIEEFMLHQGLPGGEWNRRLVSVGRPFGMGRTSEQDRSGKRIYVRTITGQSQWLPDNGIEVTVNIDENGVKRTETIRLQGFQPKTILLRRLSRNRREELRLVPEFFEPEVALVKSN